MNCGNVRRNCGGDDDDLNWNDVIAFDLSIVCWLSRRMRRLRTKFLLQRWSGMCATSARPVVGAIHSGTANESSACLLKPIRQSCFRRPHMRAKKRGKKTDNPSPKFRILQTACRQEETTTIIRATKMTEGKLTHGVRARNNKRKNRRPRHSTDGDG